MNGMAKRTRKPAAAPAGDAVFSVKARKALPYEFVLEALAAASYTTRPMFGCLAVYVKEKIVLVLRDKPTASRAMAFGSPLRKTITKACAMSSPICAPLRRSNGGNRLADASLGGARLRGSGAASLRIYPRTGSAHRQNAAGAAARNENGQSARLNSFPRNTQKIREKTIPIENVFCYSVVALVFETSARELWRQPHKAF